MTPATCFHPGRLLVLSAALACLLLTPHDAGASLADQYVCRQGDLSYTVVVNELERGSPASLYGPLADTVQQLQPGGIDSARFAGEFSYESGEIRFYGRFANASLKVGTVVLPCEMDPEPGAQDQPPEGDGI